MVDCHAGPELYFHPRQFSIGHIRSRDLDVVISNIIAMLKFSQRQT